MLTRRHFLYGVAGLAAIAAVGGGGYAYSQYAANNSSDVSTLEVPENAVFTSDDCAQVEDSSGAVSLVSSQEMPYGTLVWANDDTVAACLLPTETAKPLAQIGVMSLTAGTCTTVVEHAVGEDAGFEIYDVRACPSGIVWAEADILEGKWRIYHAALSNMTAGQPTLAQEGDAEFEMPMLAAVGNYAFWQVSPKPTETNARAACELKRARFGSDSSETVFTSAGRMATAPYATRDGVVIVPRSEATGIYYQLTHIDADSGAVTDALTLPASMKPFEAGYGKTGFMFAFEAIYSYGGGIANLGTYAPCEEAHGDGTSAGGASSYSAAPWFRFPRTPTAAPAWCGNWLVVKSTKAVCGIDLERRLYFMLDVENGADTYGDYLASTGSGSRIVTFSNIDHTPLGGDHIRHCLVRVWEAV